MRVLLLFSITLGISISAGAADDVTVDFVVRVPSTTQPAHVFIAGNHAKLGGWKADGLELKRADNGSYRGSIQVPRGTALEYKITCGTWESVEKGPGGEEVANRTLKADQD